MIELNGEESFNSALTKFLLVDEDELDLIIDQLDQLLAAAEHASYLNSIQTTH